MRRSLDFYPLLSLPLLGAMVGSLPVGILGAAVGGFFGFLEGAVLAFPLAWILGRFGGGGDSRETGEVRPAGAV